MNFIAAAVVSKLQTDISGTVDNTKDKNIRFGNLVNDSEFILDDLAVFKVRGS